MQLARPILICAAVVFGCVVACNAVAAQTAAKAVAPPAADAKQSAKQIETRSWKMVNAALAEESAERRIEAITALSTIGPRRSVARLIEARLTDKHHDVRHVAAATLGEMRSRRSVPALRRVLEDREPAVSFAAALALWHLGDRSGRAILFDVLAGERGTGPGFIKGGVRDAKKFARPANLATTGAKQGASTLLGPFALGIPLVEALRKDGGAPDRALSASLLAQDSDPESVQQLEAALGDKNWAVRVAAARALADFALRGKGEDLTRARSTETVDSERIVGALAPLLEDDKAAVRLVAAASILRLTRYAGRK